MRRRPELWSVAQQRTASTRDQFSAPIDVSSAGRFTQAAVLVGFLGVVLIVKPGGDFGAAAYVILFALPCTTTRDLSTRGLPKDIPSIFVASAGTVAAALSGLAISGPHGAARVTIWQQV